MSIMSLSIIHKPTQEACTRSAGELLTELCASQEYPILLLLSGGSACDILRDLPYTYDATHITFAVLDERFSDTLERNNYHACKETLFCTSLLACGAKSISSLPFPHWTPDLLAKHLNHEVLAWKDTHKDGRVYALQGIGRDGHTAGIMPFPEDKAMFDSLFVEHLLPYVAYDAQHKNEIPLRVTVTEFFLRFSVDVALVYACGEEKRKALQQVCDQNTALHKVPASIVNQMKHVTLFTDILVS
jgi:6-phosphogluconolactonase/glucosamine-6-phosphate isomerase/deaminase